MSTTNPPALSRDEVWKIIADVRDASPRNPRDADTDDIVDALIDRGVLRLAPDRRSAP